uniref:dihydrofolate reductase family protein n=1 Tax=Nocardioides sp. TaxID=35761 RepID=UPI0035619042
AYPWPSERRWVRAMMVTTLDGAAAGPDGLSGSISGEADKLVFDAVRRHADAVLIGAGTMRAERYGPMRAKSEDAQARQDQGLAPAPRLAIVSASLDLPWNEPVFAESALRPLILTNPGGDPALVAAAAQFCDVVPVDLADPSAILEALTDLGLRRIVCEGGPTLLSDLVDAGLVDEADITLSPTMAGTRQSPETRGFTSVVGFELVQVLTEDGFLMGRYLRPRSSTANAEGAA